jgi:hypothetical protein
MIPSLLFGCGALVTFLVALGVVGDPSGPLRTQLLELCGNGDRVAFWAAFANVTVALTPTIFAMSAEPGYGPQPAPMFAIAKQMKWGFVGLVLSILVLGWILSRFIPRKSVGTVLPRTEVRNADVWQPENE